MATLAHAGILSVRTGRGVRVETRERARGRGRIRLAHERAIGGSEHAAPSQKFNHFPQVYGRCVAGSEGPAVEVLGARDAPRTRLRWPGEIPPRGKFARAHDSPGGAGVILCDDGLVDDVFFIDLWSDVICPFCYLGTRQLTAALEQFSQRERVVIRRHAFELDPGAAATATTALAEGLAAKYDLTLEQVHSLNHRLEGEAKALGMDWSLDRARPCSTFDAHRLIALADTQRLAEAMSERLFHAYFCEGAVVAERDTLDALAREVGVSGSDQLWRGDEFAEQVRDDEDAARELGITGVPSLVLDGKFMVVGAQGAPHFLEVLNRAWARRTG